jgi:hypothetical protein
MTFWNSNKIQPKLKSRFVLVFGSYMIPTVVSVSKPKITIQNKEFKLINHYYKYPGAAKWEPITIKFVDGGGEIYEHTSGGYRKIKQANLATADFLALMLAQSGYRNHDGSGVLKDSQGSVRHSKNIATPEKASQMDNSFHGKIIIQQLDSMVKDGKVYVTEQWELYNPIISKIDWGDLSYGDDGLVEYSLDVDYDYAQLKSANFSIDSTPDSPLVSQYDYTIFNRGVKRS